MDGTRKRRLWVLLIAAAAAVIGWLEIPSSAIDRAAFTAVAHAYANPPLFISGRGLHDTPWSLRTFAASNRADARQAPVVVSLGDDPDGFFQSSPPSPIDLAVILTNFQRLGARKAATAAVLAWSDPDPIGLAALDKAIRRFDSLVMAAPLSRGAVPEPMPPAFRKASIPLASIAGDPSTLPVVNRLPLTGIILGGDNTLAGFQVLDSEPNSKLAPLIARWEDRAVFAFPLLVILQQFGLTAEDLEIRLGEYLQLGANGPTVPIDSFGRLAVPLKAIAPRALIPAAALIDSSEDLLPKHAPQPVVLRDDRSSAEPGTRAFSRQLPALIAALAAGAGVSPACDYQRPSPAVELLLLASVVLALAAFCHQPDFSRNIAFLTIAAACLTAQCVSASAVALWLPGLPALAAVLGAALVAKLIAPTPVTPAAPPSSLNIPRKALRL